MDSGGDTASSAQGNQQRGFGVAVARSGFDDLRGRDPVPATEAGWKPKGDVVAHAQEQRLELFENAAVPIRDPVRDFRDQWVFMVGEDGLFRYPEANEENGDD